MPIMAEVAKYCRARQAFCHHAEPVPQVALLYSTAAHYRETNGLFNRDLSRINGTLQALLESQLSVEVLGEHHLMGRVADYPLIVIPECDYLEPAFKQELVDYVRSGGKLLLVGPQAASLFQSELGVTFEGAPKTAVRYLAHGGSRVPTQGQTQSVRLNSKAESFGALHASDEPDSPAQPASSLAALGRGQIAATYFSFSQGYLNKRSETERAFLNELARRIFPNPLVEVKGSADVDVAVGRLGGRLIVNLVNTAGPHAEEPILDVIPPVGALEITIRTEKKPSRITLEPGDEPLSFEFRSGAAQLTLLRLDIHSVIVVE